MVRRGLREERTLQLPGLMEVRDQSQRSSVALSANERAISTSRADARALLPTDVASEPVLQTVITFRSAPLPPSPLTRSTSHSPPHFDICLLRPTSSASISRASVMRSCATSRGFLPASMAAWSVLVSRRVAAPRLTAVGRAV